QIHRLAFAIVHSTTIALPAWRIACKTHGLRVRLIPRDVVTRWNSTHNMISFAVKRRLPIDAITADKSLKLRKFELDNDDWRILEDLVRTFKCATLFYSQDTVTTIANVIPSMDKIDELLHPNLPTRVYHPAIQVAMRLGKATMNRYYSKTDLSNIYRIAMGECRCSFQSAS
ncbi:hypothetical protein JAAARDRAFT_143810, partial [Jaapia argillacea MUCL 33604]